MVSAEKKWRARGIPGGREHEKGCGQGLGRVNSNWAAV